MDDESLNKIELEVLDALASKLVGAETEAEAKKIIEQAAKTVDPSLTKEDLQKIVQDATVFEPVDKYIDNEEIEDVMVNNIQNIFVYQSGVGQTKVSERVKSKKDLDRLVRKFKMYATTRVASKNIFDVHLLGGARVNIVESPIGADITIRNFKQRALSVIDLINAGELTYPLGARMWLYAEGMGARPANLLIGGMPAAGKTTLLNAMFSFFRPEQRVVVIEETYELNTTTQENCVRLETSPDITTEELVQNALRMRPDMLVVGEVRGREAKDMMTAMNIGKISMSTIHASTSRDVVTRLEHAPMNVEKDIIPLIDAIMVISQVNENRKPVRRLTEISEISGMETQVLLSDLYSYDHKTQKGSPILPSVTYRDTLARIKGISPVEIIAEERKRAQILQRLNESGTRNLTSINDYCKEYYDNPDRAAKKLGIKV